MDSIGTALKQEIVRYNGIIIKMAATLIDIQRAIRGEVLMSAELDEQYTAMLNNQVPANWANVAYPSLKPLASWLQDLIARLEFMRTWLVHGPPNVFWFGGFYFPQGFLTGMFLLLVFFFSCLVFLPLPLFCFGFSFSFKPLTFLVSKPPLFATFKLLRWNTLDVVCYVWTRLFSFS